MPFVTKKIDGFARQRMELHGDEVLFVAFSPCGTRLASCSRDRRTLIHRLRHSKNTNSASTENTCWFEPESRCDHSTAACKAAWWPVEPYTQLVISTEDTAYHGFHGASTIEVWRTQALDADVQLQTSIHQVPAATRIFAQRTQPFDIHTAFIPWPPWEYVGKSQSEQAAALCFLSGVTVTHEISGNCIQWLEVWSAPTQQPHRTVAQLCVRCGVNYLHGLQAGSGEHAHEMLALTGSTPQLCDELAWMDLTKITRRGDTKVYDVNLITMRLGDRLLLCAKWSQDGGSILLNTRPFVPSSNKTASQNGDERLTLDEIWNRPPPDLSTTVELMILDSKTFECTCTLDGHYAFTTKACPFNIFPDDWDEDFVASGGEDGHVYVWHRRHELLLHRREGHRAPVNTVSWSPRGFLASASDDYSVIIWAPACPRHGTGSQ